MIGRQQSERDRQVLLYRWIAALIALVLVGAGLLAYEAGITTPQAATIFGATLVFIGTSGGWAVGNFFSRAREIEARADVSKREIIARDEASKREDRLKRLTLQIDKAEQQIRLFYGPLYALMQQIFAVYNAREAILAPLGWQTREEEANRVMKPDWIKGDAYIAEKYFAPLHMEIRNILKDRLHLVDEKSFPTGFRAYLDHRFLEEIAHQLEADALVPVRNVEFLPWPDEFLNDVEAGLNEARRRLDSCLSELQSTKAEEGLARDSCARSSATASAKAA